MNTIDLLQQSISDIESKLGYVFSNQDLLVLAFIHRSYINENRHVSHHNERLEFLGDSILGMIIAEFLYAQIPEMPEGDLSYLRSRLVEATSCVTYVNKLGLGKYILLGKGEQMNSGRGRESILADLFEAIIGAIYLDGGLEAAKQFLFKNFHEEIEKILKTPLSNWKAVLQDYCQKKFQQPPDYQVIEETGPDHGKFFTIAVLIAKVELGRGSGASKKEAQQSAAANALQKIQAEKQF